MKQKTKQQKELETLLEYLYIEGRLFLREIAGQFGVCPETIRIWMKEFDIPRRKARYKHGDSKSRLHQIWKDMNQYFAAIREVFKIFFSNQFYIFIVAFYYVPLISYIHRLKFQVKLCIRKKYFLLSNVYVK